MNINKCLQSYLLAQIELVNSTFPPLTHDKNPQMLQKLKRSHSQTPIHNLQIQTYMQLMVCEL